jgi:hypothetical protein
LGAELSEGHPLGVGLGFEIGAHLGDHGRPIAVGLHHDQPADPLLHSLQARRAFLELGSDVSRE